MGFLSPCQQTSSKMRVLFLGCWNKVIHKQRLMRVANTFIVGIGKQMNDGGSIMTDDPVAVRRILGL